jgi:hypothetical protein
MPIVRIKGPPVAIVAEDEVPGNRPISCGNQNYTTYSGGREPF